VAGNASRQLLLIAVSHLLLYDVKRHPAVNEVHFWDCCSNMGHFLSGDEILKRCANAHLHSIAINLKWASKISTFSINVKFL